MTIKKLFDLDLVSANDYFEDGMSAEGLDLVLTYEIQTQANPPEMHKIVFVGGRAYRWTRDALCTEEMVTAYDAMVEVEHSPWAAEATGHLRKDPVESNTLVLHHYMVYFDGGGCYEVLAESVSPIWDNANPDS